MISKSMLCASGASQTDTRQPLAFRNMLRRDVLEHVQNNSHVTQKEIRRQLEKQWPQKYLQLSTKHVRRQLTVLEQKNVVKSDSGLVPKWSSSTLECTSLDEVRELARQQVPPVQLTIQSKLHHLAEGDRYICFARWNSIEVVSRPRRLQGDADVYGAHDLLGAVAAKRHNQALALRTAASKAWYVGCTRGRPLQEGEIWQLDELLVERKGGEVDQKPQEYHDFSRQFSRESRRWLSGIVNKYWLQQAHNQIEHSVGLLEFGVHDHTCVVHGILLSVKQADDLKHADIVAACKKREDELSGALWQAFEEFKSEDSDWNAVSDVLHACHVHVRQLKQKSEQVDRRGKIVCQVELEVRLAELDVTEWCLPLPYKHKDKKTKKSVTRHGMRTGKATVPIAPVDYRRICSFFEQRPSR